MLLGLPCLMQVACQFHGAACKTLAAAGAGFFNLFLQQADSVFEGVSCGGVFALPPWIIRYDLPWSSAPVWRGVSLVV